MFGALEIVDGERHLGPRDLGGVRPKQLLEILLASRGHHVPTERIAELLWGDSRPADIAASIQTFVSVLRRKLVDERERARRLVVTEAEAYRFATERIELDLDRFDELLEHSAREPTRTARRLLEQALSLVRGDVLEDEPYATWAGDLRGSYQGRVLGARLDAAEAALAERDFARALAHAEGAARQDRFSERARRLSMLSLYALDRQHDALARYRAYRFMLDDELGLEPTTETRALESAILRQVDPQSLLPRATGETIRVDRSSPLLGRDAELRAVSDAVREALDGDVVVIQIDGESGLGKTRLLDELAFGLPNVRVGRATCSALESHLPYVPLAASLRDAIADVEIDGGRLPPLRAIFPELNLDAPNPGFSEVEVLEALVALVGAHGPLVLLLDDIDWADPQTLAAIEYLRRRGAGRRAALVTTVAAPELQSVENHSLNADLVISLEPLSAADLMPLGIAGLHAWTGGNPRFVAETLKCDGEITPPRALASALIAQCRAEGAWSYRVLTAAALLEQPFEPATLAQMLEVEASALVEELERLCERRLLRIDGLGFRFRYDLVRQVLLENVSPARRRLLQDRADDDAEIVAGAGL
jgi:DNA-binding SARP family transcriptional activator